MDTEAPWLILNTDNVEHWGMGMGFDEDLLALHRPRSRSPANSSICLTPGKASVSHTPPYERTPPPQFGRSSAPSPESLVGGGRSMSSRLVLPPEQVYQDMKISVATPKTPEVEPTSSLSTTPTFAGPMESYLACPQTHERRALRLSADGDAEDDDWEPGGSVVMGRRRLPGVYRPRKRSLSPAAVLPEPKTPKLAHAMERYLTSTDSHELLAYRMQETAQAVETDQHDFLSGPSSSQLFEATVPISGEAISVAAEAGGSAEPLVISMNGPIEVGSPIEAGTQQSGNDSAIEDLGMDDVHQRFLADRRARFARERIHRPQRTMNRVEKPKRMRTRR